MIIGKIWTKAIKESADPKRSRHFFDLLAATTAWPSLKNYTAEEARILAAVLSGSQALGNLLVSKPELIEVIKPSALQFSRRPSGLFEEVNQLLEPYLKRRDYEGAFSRLRAFKQTQMLRIAARDLAWLSNAKIIVQEISDVADVCLEFVWRICRENLIEKHGHPQHQQANGIWHSTRACIIGLGKLGGRELNYSSDVDIIFVYEEEGVVAKPELRKEDARYRGNAKTRDPGQSRFSNHQFFNRLAEACVAQLTRLGSEGSLYRVDLRLRPEGDAGPLTRSLEGYENYYAQWGQTWERMMLMKSRKVAGDEAIAHEFIEMVQPFRYPRSVNENVLTEMAAMKERIENEIVKTGDLDRNVKLGRGGIREIEFIAQVLQLLHAGRQPFLQESQTLASLEKLVQYELLDPKTGRVLHEAYLFLRDVEHRLQMEENRQTHSIPRDRSAVERLARLMQFSTLKQFTLAHRNHTRKVRRLFENLLRTETEEEFPRLTHPEEFQGHENDWTALLLQHGFKDIPKALRVLREFVEGPGYVHVSSRTRGLALQLISRLFAMCPPEAKAGPSIDLPRKIATTKIKTRLSDPDRVVTRLDGFIAAYGARGTLFELWNSNPALFDLLVLLFDRSEFLAEMAIRTPDLVDELVVSGRLNQRKSSGETLRDLRHGLEDADQYQWLRRYHQAELMRIGLRDILNLTSATDNSNELCALADACLQYALEVVVRKNRLKSLPFAIIGLGKIGGQEIDYGSDLDLIFVAPAGAKNPGKLVKLAIEVMDLLSARTENGLVFVTDARLRPDGEKGLLVNSLSAYESYYRNRAQLWEIQALTRSRPIAGDIVVGEQYQKLAIELTNFSHPSLPLAAYVPHWKDIVRRMRMRIEKERTPVGKSELAIKTGRGGLMDAEFIAQILCLANGWHEPNTLDALRRANASGKLPQGNELIVNYSCLLRIERILRRWSYEAETVLPVDPAAFERVAIRCGFDSADEFRASVAQAREKIAHLFSNALNGYGINDE